MVGWHCIYVSVQCVVSATDDIDTHISLVIDYRFIRFIGLSASFCDEPIIADSDHYSITVSIR